jgi:NTE family protein
MKAIPQNDFAQLKIPLFVTATDLNSCSSITFSEGLLNEVIVGSSAVPAVFDPIPYQQFLLVDGGVLNDFPVDCLSGRCEKIIGSHVNKLVAVQARLYPGFRCWSDVFIWQMLKKWLPRRSFAI